MAMTISYNKLWKVLVDKKMSKADLRRATEMASNTMTSLRRDKKVSLDVLLQSSYSGQSLQMYLMKLASQKKTNIQNRCLWQL